LAFAAQQKQQSPQHSLTMRNTPRHAALTPERQTSIAKCVLRIIMNKTSAAETLLPELQMPTNI